MNIIKKIEELEQNNELKQELKILNNRIRKLESFLDDTLSYPVPSKRKIKIESNQKKIN